MRTENWMKKTVVLDYQKQAVKAVEKRRKWEEEQLNEGKKEMLVPHPTLPRTTIVRYV